MGALFSQPTPSEESHHRHHHHHKKEDSDEGEEEVAETPKTTKSQKSENRKRQKEKINKKFISETIADPTGDQPCGLFVDGLNFHWEREKFQKFLKNNDIAFSNAFKKKREPFGIIYFDNNQDRAEAYKTLIQMGDQGNRQLFVVALERKKMDSQKQCQKLRKRATSDLDTRDIDDRMAPWHNMPYEEQIQRKSAKFTEIIAPIIPDPENNITVFKAPKLSGYRNNTELTIGYDLDGNVCVGFNLGSRSEDVIAPVKSTFNCPEGTPEIAEKVRNFVVESGIPVFDRVSNTGHWKFIKIRSNEANEIMLMFVVYGSIGDEGINALKAAFENEVDSLYYCETKTFESYGKDPNIIHLAGKEVLIETLRGLQFEISPKSFFQTNTSGAELLFQKVEELAGVDKDTILIDVCCGTGVIGLAMARNVKLVVGIDIEEQAIADARRNAEKNGLTNTEYILAGAEVAVPEILPKYAVDGQKVVAIVDPPRDGLLKKACKALRKCELLKRIVYISCNANSLVRDAQNYLFNDGYLNTEPFRPTTYFGVDMFPHTDRCEIVMLMERE